MFTNIFIVILNASWCFCFAGYDLFQGFNMSYGSSGSKDVIYNSLSDNEYDLEKFLYSLQIQQDSTTPTSANGTSTTPDTVPIRTKKVRFRCPEEEHPINIGPYEVPTQRDLVIFTKNMLLDTYNSYNKNAFYLLRDIKEATKATLNIEKKCIGDKQAYRKCIKRVSVQCQQITKNLVRMMENQKHEISELTKDRICNIADMKTDPIQILKSIAQEKISLEFALPGFLRLLHACSLNCTQLETKYYKNKPMRHMTDQDLVIKHFLTRKNYLELIKDSGHKTIANSN